jgi:steroid 5-alpha reductase family enzyme
MNSLTSIFLINAVAVFTYMSVWFIYSFNRKRLDVVDTAWGGGFIVVAIMTFIQHPSRLTAAVASMVVLWGIRLMLHIYSRNKGKANDERYDELTKSWNKDNLWIRAYLSIFLLQGALVLLVGLPITLAGNVAADSFNLMSLLGGMIWLTGFLLEVIADKQLANHLRHHDRPNKVMNRGLWRYSRHPNYFGEITAWWGIGILVASIASVWWLPLIGPVAISYLIIFVSGLPPLERRHRDNPAYADYNRRTSVLIPLPPRRN